MATGNKRVNSKLSKGRERRKIVCGDGNEYPVTTRITGFKAFWILQLKDLEEYEQQAFVWNREVILNLN